MMKDLCVAEAADGIDYFFFGPLEKQLLGAYHHPRSDLTRDSAVLLCYPWGKEYLSSHRAFRQLAELLADIGYAVLRFDYSGTGDSAGDGESSTLCSWVADISAAMDELRRRAAPETICLIGLRLGASLAVRASGEHADVRGLVLWQPVMDGATYLTDLREHHRTMHWKYFPSMPKSQADSVVHDIMGFPVPDEQIEELRALEVRTVPATAGPILIVDNLSDPALASWSERLVKDRRRAEYAALPTFAVWDEDIDKGLVPRPTLERIGVWVEMHCP